MSFEAREGDIMSAGQDNGVDLEQREGINCVMNPD